MDDMLDEEFEQIKRSFQKASQGELRDLQNVFQGSLHFFEKLKKQIIEGKTEEKMEAIRMMTELYQEMMKETKTISERLGMSQEELAKFAENPENFTKEQWDALQSSKQQIEAMGKQLAGDVSKAESAPLAEKKKNTPLPPQTKRSDWMKS